MRIQKGASREDNLIKANGFDFSFRIPYYWIKWHEENEERPNIHLTKEALTQVKEANGEWDKDFAMILNSILPFEQCIAHVGREGWGDGGISFSDLQLRTYILTDSIDVIEKELVSEGAKAIGSITNEPFLPSTEELNGWKRVVLKFTRIYKDYGAEVTVDLWFIDKEGITFLFAFMYTNQQKLANEIDEIINSVSFSTKS
ncbi:hypothetical protein R9C00_03415 [Flammeovirgaceae bacterium SG7u.111]|nr:hypothetical protein [Flammeovirgaceae bacterium SG7u.132]WPO36492.1 hypothetical protein R9C00_03415 [Flammeovirgaceae bacterium SG7u.111]